MWRENGKIKKRTKSPVNGTDQFLARTNGYLKTNEQVVNEGFEKSLKMHVQT